MVMEASRVRAYALIAPRGIEIAMNVRNDTHPHALIAPRGIEIHIQDEVEREISRLNRTKRN